MIDFKQLAKLAGLNDDVIENLIKQLNLEDADAAYQRGQNETLNRVNTLVEITLIAVKNNPALREVAETIKKWMKEGIQPLDTPAPVEHSFINFADGKWYHPEKNILIIRYNDNFYSVYLPHHSLTGFNIRTDEVESVMVKLS